MRLQANLTPTSLAAAALDANVTKLLSPRLITPTMPEKKKKKKLKIRPLHSDETLPALQ
jgi:uncharacterized protein (UPF0371 family)